VSTVSWYPLHGIPSLVHASAPYQDRQQTLEDNLVRHPYAHYLQTFRDIES
jgi:hypothetical protein